MAASDYFKFKNDIYKPILDKYFKGLFDMSNAINIAYNMEKEKKITFTQLMEIKNFLDEAQKSYQNLAKYLSNLE